MNFGKFYLKQVLLKKVQGEPSGKTLVSDPPTGGSTDHVDQRGVWGKKYFIIKRLIKRMEFV